MNAVFVCVCVWVHWKDFYLVNFISSSTKSVGGNYKIAFSTFNGKNFLSLLCQWNWVLIINAFDCIPYRFKCVESLTLDHAWWVTTLLNYFEWILQVVLKYSSRTFRNVSRRLIKEEFCSKIQFLNWKSHQNIEKLIMRNYLIMDILKTTTTAAAAAVTRDEIYKFM